MNRFLRILTAGLLLALAGCIRNDIPYPVVELQITALEGQGFTASIDAAQRLVTLKLDEATDIRKVHIDRIAATEGASVSCEVPGVYDLRSPLYVTLSLYQEYVWTVQAEQTIDRQFRVAGQVGAEEIDAKNHIARAYVGANVDLEHVQVTELKLGPAEGTTYSPTLEEFADADFRSARMVDVTAYGRTEQWWLFVEKTDSKIAVGAADLWHNTATVTAIVTEEEHAAGVSLQYRIQGAEQWIEMENPSYESGILSATLTPQWNASTNANQLTVYTPDASKGLFAGGVYEIRLLVGGQQMQLLEYTAPAGDEIPGGDMEGDLSCFTIDNTAAAMWGSGNNTLKRSLCTAATCPGMEGSQCAKLSASETLKILASGNLFTGTFKMAGTTGTVGFGQKFAYTARPKSLRFRYHATIGAVDIRKYETIQIGTQSFPSIAVGEKDISSVYVAIVDWSARHEVSSGISAPTGAWDPSAQSNLEGSGKIIAYGVLDLRESTSGEEMVEAEIPLLYYDTEASAPQGSYTIVISCSTSKYGDFMNGCSTNVLYVDDFRWGY